MLNLWFPFLVNRIKITFVSDDFHKIIVELKHSFLNRNPNKSLWGGSITSALDPFYPIMIKQIMLQKGIKTDFYSKAIHVEFLKQANTNLTFQFQINDNEIEHIYKTLEKNEKYDDWHPINGLDVHGNICVQSKIQVYLRRR
tara:strand:- start:2962 stop:3387 length:426 start_codon:yes stop_codon:yes gene_type:complete